MRYEIFKGSNGKYVFQFGRWGFYNIGWTGRTQPVINDPNDRTVIQFEVEEDARAMAEELTKTDSTTWEKI